MIPKPPKRKKPPVKIYPCGREVCSKTAAGEAEYRRRREYMDYQRQDGKCAICGEPFTWRNPSTFDHQSGRGMGGGIRQDAIFDAEGNWINAAVHLYCNTAKGSRKYHWLDGKYIPK